jgi:hypothetical protein
MGWMVHGPNNQPKFRGWLMSVSKLVIVVLLVNTPKFGVSRGEYLKLPHIPEMCKFIYWIRDEW